MKKHVRQLISFVLITSLLGISGGVSSAQQINDLQQSINEKTKELQEVNRRIQQAQAELDSTQEQSRSLSRELKTIGYTVNQLNLGIKSSEINIDKLRLELESLGIKMVDIENNIESKKTAIAGTLREIQRNDDLNLVTILLKSGSLAESLSEVQNLNDLNTGLSLEVEQLETLRNDLQSAVINTERKKEDVEIESHTLKSRKTILAGEQQYKDRLLEETKNQEKLYQQKIEELESLQQEISEEIDAIEFELRKQIDPSLLPIPREGVLLNPVKGILTQGYGATTYARYHYKSRWHNGIDVGAPIGTPIVATEDGTVAFVADQDAVLTNGRTQCRGGAYGKVVVVKHTNNLATLSAHMSQIAVVEGQKVERGQVIGYIGRSGWATGPHIHFVVFDSSTYRLNPTRVCGLMPVGGDLDPFNYIQGY